MVYSLNLKKSRILKTIVFPYNFMKININKKIIKAINKIIKEFPEDTDGSKLDTPTEWINWVLNWYIRNIFTNGNDYIDRD